jgi:CBS domain containing-hemolysin-like protein
MDSLIKICAILALVGLNAFFVAAEFALVGARATRLQTLAETGDRRALLALKALAHLDDCISGTQLGITLASLALGWIGEATLAVLFVSIFAGLPSPFATLATHAVAGTVAFAGITFLHIVLGELAPKSLALLHPERVSRWVAPPLLLFTHVFWPAIWLLNKSAVGFLHLFAVRPPAHAERVHDPEELLLLLSESRKHGLVGESNAEMIAGVFDLAHTSVRQAMTPRTDMEAVERHWPLDRVVEVIQESGYSRLPVYEEDLDHIVGILLAKDLLEFFDGQRPFSVDAVMREPFFIPETMRVDLLMQALQERNAHLAIVVDEYGGTLGLVTLEDLIEEIVGDIFDEFDQHQMTDVVQATAEGHLSVPGDLPITELNERYHFSFPEDDYITVAGLVLAALEHVPTVGEHVQVQGVTFCVTQMDHLRIERLEITLPPVPEDQLSA